MSLLGYSSPCCNESLLADVYHVRNTYVSITGHAIANLTHQLYLMQGRTGR